MKIAMRHPAEVDVENSRRRNKKGYSDTDHGKLVSHDSSDVSDSIAHPYAEKLRRQKAKSDRKDDMNPLRSAFKMPSLSETDDFMVDFIDDKLKHQARMTSHIRSTLKTLESKINNRRRVISEVDDSTEGEI